MPTVAIIGTAGRNGTHQQLSRNIFTNMVDTAKRIIKEEFKLDPSQVQLVSGGAAWSDHVAVWIYLDCPEFTQLKLCLPCKWDANEKQFDATSKWGESSNSHHRMFSSESMKEIDSAIQQGATVQVYDGFFKRNNVVAKSEYMIAFGIEPGDQPPPGGTHYTWSRCQGHKQYVVIE